MTDSDWLKDLLEEEWSLARDPVPEYGNIRLPLNNQPKFIISGSPDRRADQVDTQPLVFIDSGGTPQREPASVGYRDEHVEAELSVEIVVSGDKRDFNGRVDSDYGGVSGEFKRIMDKHRKGLIESDVSVPNPRYDLIVFDRFDDDAERRGAGIWTGEWTVRFITFAQKILHK